MALVVAALAVAAPAVIATAALAVAIAMVGLTSTALVPIVPVGLLIWAAIMVTIQALFVSNLTVGGVAAKGLISIVPAPIAVLVLLGVENDLGDGASIHVAVMLKAHEISHILHRGVLKIVLAVA